MGLLSTQQVEASRNNEQRTGAKQGLALVESGLITEQQLNGALERQIAEIFYGIMRWREGTFEFLEEEAPGPDVYRVRESVTNLIMQATRQLDEWGLIEKVFPSMETVVIMTPPKQPAGDIRLQPDEWQILTFIDGKRTIREICALSSQTNFEVCKKLLNLHHAGLVAPSEARSAATPPPPPSSQSNPGARLVPASFLPTVRGEFTKLVGPIANILFDEVADALGVPLERLPQSRVAEFTKLLCNEIDAPQKRDAFRELVARAAKG
jgi:hypothetical protein